MILWMIPCSDCATQIKSQRLLSRVNVINKKKTVHIILVKLSIADSIISIVSVTSSNDSLLLFSVFEAWFEEAVGIRTLEPGIRTLEPGNLCIR